MNRHSRFDAWDRVLRAGALGWPRWMGGEFRMGNICTPMKESSQCMAKQIQYCEIKKETKKSKVNQFWKLFGRTDAEAKVPTLARWFEDLTHWKRISSLTWNTDFCLVLALGVWFWEYFFFYFRIINLNVPLSRTVRSTMKVSGTEKIYNLEPHKCYFLI